MTDQLKQAKRIRRLNDKLRRQMPHGSVIISRSLGQMFSNDQLRDITELIRHYDAFGSSGDQEEWHDHGTVEYGETNWPGHRHMGRWLEWRSSR